MSSSSQSILIVGAGIVGLCSAVVLQSRGHRVRLMARDKPEATASGVAAGMIAPALEAMNEADPAVSFARLTRAQQNWFGLQQAWPERVRARLPVWSATPSYYLWRSDDSEGRARLALTGAHLTEADAATRAHFGIDDRLEAVHVAGDWSVPSVWLMAELAAHFARLGGQYIRGEADAVESGRVHLRDGGWLMADHVIIAAGQAGHSLRAMVPSLAHLSPIKGHMLDLPERIARGVLRAASGYLAMQVQGAKFGATMEAGRDDSGIDPLAVADLKARAQALFPGLDLHHAVARTGVRAATPDGWPLIGRDPSSGVWLATGMRRNGYVFAPMAAQALLDMIEGRETVGCEACRPGRFSEY
ncbi:FAD-dependent oxidoreductase [Asticcacaulis sp. EMRT-3]|uniref:NAD(P)/FAD-dependent oxidoreductase n=1 Tax=Asticcacaulis sp. EMRT-3 TaxID=3040349 RepID=UPI0024AF5FB2|nr:FAD-dependent oxidoreductase [Asticcacaulis sp. EMRT-3]MDI7774941.1 FAD-dependent oxidoreductase [Asticcacaulis sp. EMRT-3]